MKCLPVAMTPSGEIVRLQTFDIRHSKMADEQRVFAEGFLHTPPPRIACYVQHGGKPLPRADGKQLLADRSRHRLGELGLEGAGKPQHLRVHRPAQHHRA